MTVGELIKELQDCNPEAMVLVQSDPEGNSYRAARGASLEFAKHDYGELWDVHTKEDLDYLEESEEDYAPAVVVFP